MTKSTTSNTSNNFSLDRSNHEQMNRNNTSGLSLFGFDDDSNINDESLLLSPILADYITNTNGKNANSNNGAVASSLSSTLTSTLTVPQFTSPPPSTRKNNHNSNRTQTPLSSSYSLTSSSKRRVRSSARLRRRRELLFSSPIEQKFKIDETVLEEGREEVEGGSELEGENGSKLEGQDGDEKKDIEAIEPVEVTEVDHGMEDHHRKSFGTSTNTATATVADTNTSRNMNIKISRNSNERTKKLLLLGEELETSFCPSLGLGSSISDGGGDGVGDHGRISSIPSENSCHDRNYDDHYANKEENHKDGEESLEQRTNLKDNEEENHQSLQLHSIQQDYQGTYEFEKQENSEKEQGEEPQEHELHNENRNENETLTNKHHGESQHSNSHETLQKDRSKISIHSFLDELEGVYTVSNDFKDEESNSVESSTNVSKIAFPKKIYNDDLNGSNGVGSDDSNGDKADQKTPPRSFSISRKNSLSLTPKLKEVAKKALTPVLDAIQSKVMQRKAMSSVSSKMDFDVMMNSSSLQEIDGNVSVDELVHDLKKKVSFYDEKDDSVDLSSFKSPPLLVSNQKTTEVSTSLTPVLKSLRSKLYVDQLGDHKENTSKNEIGHHGATKTSKHESFMENYVSDEFALRTPGHENKESFKTSMETEELSLTPALKALRSKLLRKPSIDSSSQSTAGFQSDFLTADSSTSITPNLVKDAPKYRGSLRSPPIREPIPVKTPNTASLTNKSNLTYVDDSYLAQPKDLSSAKKNLNAQSSALVERLRGASQRRMVHLTKKRDSLAAKESQHLKRQESECSDTDNENINKRMIEQSEKKQKNTGFKVRPAPATIKVDKGKIGVSNIVKKPLTKAISPKLSLRRGGKSSSENIREKSLSFKAKPMPNFDSYKGFPKKKRQATKPKSPALGLKRQSNNNQKCLNKESLQMSEQQGNSYLRKRNESNISPPELLGLGFLSETKKLRDSENIPPSHASYGFHLHTAERAKDRANFNSAFAVRERERQQQKRKDVAKLIKMRLQELEVLKQSL